MIVQNRRYLNLSVRRCRLLSCFIDRAQKSGTSLVSYKSFLYFMTLSEHSFRVHFSLSLSSCFHTLFLGPISFLSLFSLSLNTSDCVDTCLCNNGYFHVFIASIFGSSLEDPWKQLARCFSVITGVSDLEWEAWQHLSREKISLYQLQSGLLGQYLRKTANKDLLIEDLQ